MGEPGCTGNMDGNIVQNDDAIDSGLETGNEAESPEESARLETERVLRDAILIREGATYRSKPGGGFELVLTPSQIQRQQMVEKRDTAMAPYLTPLTEQEKQKGFLYKSTLPDGMVVATKKEKSGDIESLIYVNGKPLGNPKKFQMILHNYGGDSLSGHNQAVAELSDKPECPKCNHGKLFEVEAGSGGTDSADSCTSCDYYR